MQVLDSLIDGALELSDERAANELIGMIVRYLRTGAVPCPNDDVQAMALGMVMPVLERSRRRIVAGKNGGKNKAATTQEAKDTRDVSVSKPASKEPSKTLSKQGSKPRSDLDSSSLFLTPNTSPSMSLKEGDSNKQLPYEVKGRFKPPSVEEVQAFCTEKGYAIDAEAFVAYYESKGWKIGTSPMKSWRAACVTWHRRQTPKLARKEVIRNEYAAL